MYIPMWVMWSSCIMAMQRHFLWWLSHIQKCTYMLYKLFILCILQYNYELNITNYVLSTLNTQHNNEINIIQHISNTDKARSTTPSLQTTPESALYDYRTHSSFIFYLAAKWNIRIITVDCRSIKGKAPEFTAAVPYIKPNMIYGTHQNLGLNLENPHHRCNKI